jgi:hypothetical protein
MDGERPFPVVSPTASLTQRPDGCPVVGGGAATVNSSQTSSRQSSTETKRLHDIIGGVSGWIAGQFGVEPMERTVTRELARRIHIPPVDEKAVVVARGLQMIGILFCGSGNIPLDGAPASSTWFALRPRNGSRRYSLPR